MKLKLLTVTLLTLSITACSDSTSEPDSASEENNSGEGSFDLIDITNANFTTPKRALPLLWLAAAA